MRYEHNNVIKAILGSWHDHERVWCSANVESFRVNSNRTVNVIAAKVDPAMSLCRAHFRLLLMEWCHHAVLILDFSVRRVVRHRRDFLRIRCASVRSMLASTSEKKKDWIVRIGQINWQWICIAMYLYSLFCQRLVPPSTASMARVLDLCFDSSRISSAFVWGPPTLQILQKVHLHCLKIGKQGTFSKVRWKKNGSQLKEVYKFRIVRSTTTFQKVQALIEFLSQVFK